jgi:serine-type D-Ala-D-Ala endopeptidase (penicillin-binding protein 7)
MKRMQQRRMTSWLPLLLAVLVGGVAAPAPAEAASDSTQAKKTTAGSAPAKRTTQAKGPVRKKAPAKKAQPANRYSASRTKARDAQVARARAARAAQYQQQLRDLQTPLFRTGDDGSLVPAVRAEAAIIYNPITREILWQENADNPRSIASITKVMTAVVYLENEFDLQRQVVVNPVDLRFASVTYLRPNERIRVNDLLHLLLIASDNAAARTLARHSPHGPSGFLKRMNDKAEELGLTHTRYADPSGLDSANISSALDMARLITFASSDERIAEIMRKSDHRLTTSTRTFTVNNTNKLLGSDVDVRGGKTGFISKAGYCLATLLRLPQTDEQVAVVVLGARSNAGRFMETRHLLNWVSTKTQSLVEPQLAGQTQVH